LETFLFQLKKLLKTKTPSFQAFGLGCEDMPPRFVTMIFLLWGNKSEKKSQFQEKGQKKNEFMLSLNYYSTVL
jgi:hypothetical protein